MTLRKCATCKTTTNICSKCRRPPEIKNAYTTVDDTLECAGETPSKECETGTSVLPRDHFTHQLVNREAYPVAAYSHLDVEKFLKWVLPSVPPTFNFVAHAMVWAIAEKYLIRTLQELALHLIHRELSACSVETGDCHGIVDPIKYA